MRTLIKPSSSGEVKGGLRRGVLILLAFNMFWSVAVIRHM